MLRPYLQQVHQSGATDRQFAQWSASGGVWVPVDLPLTPCRTTFVAAGGEVTVLLGVTPIASSEQVLVNGIVRTWGVDYTLTGTNLTLTVALTAGDRISVLYWTSGTVCGLATLVAAGAAASVPFLRPVQLDRQANRRRRSAPRALPRKRR